MKTKWLWTTIAVMVLAGATGAVMGQTIRLAFEKDGSLFMAERETPAGMGLMEASVRLLVTGPTAAEASQGVITWIPAGVEIVSLTLSADGISIDMTPLILQGLDEAALLRIYQQFRITLTPFDDVNAIRLTCQESLLSSYLTPPVPVGEAAAPLTKKTGMTALVGLGGRNITIGPSHGRFWNGSGWYWQRSDPCGFGEAVLEDTNSIRLCQFLYQYLAQDGATVHVPRELNESNCCHPENGLSWWKQCAQSWLRINGLPCSVWASYTGNCGADSATGRSSDDIRARPLFADYRGSEIYIAHHTNAGGGGTANGTETFRDTAMEHPTHETNSYNLAVAVQNNVISAIRNMYDGSWSDRGVKDSAGGFGEIRIPNRPAILIELAFHDNCTRDAAYLTDNFFRSVSEWGIYKGVCSYFGTTATWDKYSDEYVSDTIPTTMTEGQTYNVSVTFRNRGVVWSEGRSFRLGAVGDSDPFAASTRYTISGEVRPGNTYTFNFQMTAPAGGDYVSDWRMVRDGVAWFGATLTRNIHVNPLIVDTEPPTTPTNLTANVLSATSVQLSWTASTDNIGVAGYDIRRNGSVIGSSTGTNYTDNAAPSDSSLTYDVRAKDATPNYSGWSTPVTVYTPPAPPVATVVFSDGFNGNLNNWTQQVGAFAYSTVQNHGTYTGGGAAYVAATETDQMYHTFTRPFAQCKGWGYFYDGMGGWKQGTCGWAYRQGLCLRDMNNEAKMFIDNTFYSASNNANYFFRLVGNGGIAYTAYATRNPSTACSGAWIYFETTVTPGAPGASPTGTFTVKVTDGAGTTTSTQNLTTDYSSYGVGRVTLGLGVSSANEGYWDDIAFQATPPDWPVIGTPDGVTVSSIQWNFTPRDNNLFGWDVASSGGTIVSPSYPATGWLNRLATSWTETGLTANTQYTRKVRAWNGTLNGAYSLTASATTLSVAPTAGSVTPSSGSVCLGENVVWTAVGGFGAGKVAYYRFAWNQNAGYAFTGSEPVWSSGTIATQPTSAGTWYLHVRGYNSADVANGSYSYALTPKAATAISQQPTDQSVPSGGTAQFTVTATGDGTMSYQWKKDGSDLVDGGHINGATTNTLTITDADASDAGSYLCVVTAGCGSLNSAVATLTISGSLCNTPKMDTNGDLHVDAVDFDAFSACYNGPTNPVAGDCVCLDDNGDQYVDAIDFDVFSACYNGPTNPPGC